MSTTSSQVVTKSFAKCRDAALDLRLVTNIKGTPCEEEENVRGVRHTVSQVHPESFCASRSIRTNQPGSQRVGRKPHPIGICH